MKLRCVIKYTDDARIAALVETPRGLRRVDHRWYTKNDSTSLPDGWMEALKAEIDYSTQKQVGVDDLPGV